MWCMHTRELFVLQKQHHRYNKEPNETISWKFENWSNNQFITNEAKKNGPSYLSIIAVIMVIDKSNRFLDDDEDEQSKQVKPS